MSNYVLSCCSAADLPRERFEEIGVPVMSLHFYIDGKEYQDDLGLSISYDEFYKRMSAGADTHTAQANIDEYCRFFTPFLEKGLDVVHVCMSSGLSGTINSARNAALILSEQFPERHVFIVDSLGASGGFGLLMDTAADRRDEGMSAQELAQWIEDNALKMNHWFFSTDLSSYVKGGRISKTAAVFGGMLEICPLLNMNNTGHLIPRFKVRTKKKVIKEIVSHMEQCADNGTDYADKCLICHSGCLEDAQAVAALVEERFPALRGKVQLSYIGTTVGAHTGPGTVALFFWGALRGE